MRSPMRVTTPPMRARRSAGRRRRACRSSSRAAPGALRSTRRSAVRPSSPPREGRPCGRRASSRRVRARGTGASCMRRRSTSRSSVLRAVGARADPVGQLADDGLLRRVRDERVLERVAEVGARLPGVRRGCDLFDELVEHVLGSTPSSSKRLRVAARDDRRRSRRAPRDAARRDPQDSPRRGAPGRPASRASSGAPPPPRPRCRPRRASRSSRICFSSCSTRNSASLRMRSAFASASFTMRSRSASPAAHERLARRDDLLLQEFELGLVLLGPLLGLVLHARASSISLAIPSRLACRPSAMGFLPRR